MMFGTCIHGTRLDESCQGCVDDANVRYAKAGIPLIKDPLPNWSEFDPWHTRPKPKCDCGGAKLKLPHSHWCSAKQEGN